MKRYTPSMMNSRPVTVAAANDLLNSIYSYWKLDESSGTAFDSLGNCDLDTPSASPPTYGVTGEINTALLFASASLNAIANLTSDANFDSSSYSVSGWVKRTSISTLQAIMAHNVSNTNGWALRLDASNKVSLRHYGVAIVTSTGTITDTTSFHHVAITYDGVNVSFYIDGAFDSSVALGAIIPATGGEIIGAATNGAANFFNGVIDEVGFWTRVLTAAEITALYNSGSGLSYPF